jgi:hypothetical protein
LRILPEDPSLEYVRIDHHHRPVEACCVLWYYCSGSKGVFFSIFHSDWNERRLCGWCVLYCKAQNQVPGQYVYVQTQDQRYICALLRHSSSKAGYDQCPHHDMNMRSVYGHYRGFRSVYLATEEVSLLNRNSPIQASSLLCRLQD